MLCSGEFFPFYSDRAISLIASVHWGKTLLDDLEPSSLLKTGCDINSSN